MTPSDKNGIELSTNRKNLLQLIYLRAVAIIAQVVALFVVHYGIGFPLPLWAMMSVIGLQVLLNLAATLRYSRAGVITDFSLFLELLVDVAAFAGVIFLSGGATNPFISLFLLQVIIGAVLLRPPYAWTLAGVTTFCYLLLAVMPVPLIDGRHSHLDPAFHLHVLGMLVSYAVAAFLLVAFVTKINRNLRERDESFAQLREQVAEEAQLMRFGLLATSAAHELGTPLSTLSVILKDWEDLGPPDAAEERADDITMMSAQLKRCKEIVSSILASSGEVRGEAARLSTLHDFFDQAMQDWQNLRRPTQLNYRRVMADDMPIVADKVIERILFNVLDNAHEASPTQVDVDVQALPHAVQVTVRDYGVGFTPQGLPRFGQLHASEKSGTARGVGLYLVVTTLKKLGGSAQPQNHPQGGAVVTLTIPLSAIRIGS